MHAKATHPLDMRAHCHGAASPFRKISEVALTTALSSKAYSGQRSATMPGNPDPGCRALNHLEPTLACMLAREPVSLHIYILLSLHASVGGVTWGARWNPGGTRGEHGCLVKEALYAAAALERRTVAEPA